FSGLAYDLIQALGKELDLKIEWTEETGWGSFNTGLDTGRYDVICTPVWQSGQRAKIVLLSEPLYFNALVALKRKSDKKPYATLDRINTPDVTVSVIDGDITQAVLKAEFPNAKPLAAPAMSDGSQNLLDVATKKADIAFSTWDGMERYNKNNPENLLMVAANGAPVRLFGNSLAFQRKDYDMKLMFDAALRTIYTSGKAQKIIKKYEPGFYPAATPYALPNQE
ncbi:MAG: transporter substrate-binding domain-containing protein, partial [Alphaproteobacteria bacterium]|nr:transporter substrate-binding domain-containing protein [Alphaproteobacteria bacterium]